MMYTSIELQLLKNRLESIADDMALTVVRTAYSTNLRNSMDFSTGFCDPGGPAGCTGTLSSLASWQPSGWDRRRPEPV
jgi:N-methylhydantoinase B/oxoprolinase/acetone carboxylase alpha subunit